MVTRRNNKRYGPAPTWHRPEHVAVVAPGEAPYRPALQLVHTALPTAAYVPAGQSWAVGDVDPSLQAYPAVQGPSHVDEVAPGAVPYRPAAQVPVHCGDDCPGEAP